VKRIEFAGVINGLCWISGLSADQNWRSDSTTDGVLFGKYFPRPRLVTETPVFFSVLRLPFVLYIFCVNFKPTFASATRPMAQPVRVFNVWRRAFVASTKGHIAFLAVSAVVQTGARSLRKRIEIRYARIDR